MTDPVDPLKIQLLVGASQHQTRHIARANPYTQKVYISHPDECAARLTLRPLTDCKYSRALDRGIDVARWVDSMDKAVFVYINVEGRLFPQEEVPND